MHSSIVIANRFLELAQEKTATLTPMQLLKLVYIAHGWNLGLYGNPLIEDEVQAWQYGPVIPKLYNKIKDFRGNPVRGPINGQAVSKLSERELDLIHQVFDGYGELSGGQLSGITHKVGTPWDQTYKSNTFGLQISNDVIQYYYAKLAQAA